MNKYEEMKETYRELTSVWNGSVQHAKRYQFAVLVEILEKLDKLLEAQTNAPSS